MMKRRPSWQLSLQLKPLYEEFMLLKRMMTCLQLKPYWLPWRPSSSLLDRRFLLLLVLSLALCLCFRTIIFLNTCSFLPFQIANLQDDNKALDRLTKSKEAALLEAERTVQVALAKASMVDDLQNKNQELMKQIEICQVLQYCVLFHFYLHLVVCSSSFYLFPNTRFHCNACIYQEENKILDKMHRHKVAEVEKLTQTVRELEEAVLAGGAAANAVRDYQRKVQEMNVMCYTLPEDELSFTNRSIELSDATLIDGMFLFLLFQEERKTLDRELARAKVTANRVATVVANEWKDANDKVMPVKQWLEERRFLQVRFITCLSSSVFLCAFEMGLVYF